MTVRRLLLMGFALLLGAASCTSEPPSDGALSTSFAAQLASSWHYAGAPQRVQVGIVASDANGLRLVTQGTVDVAFAYRGTDGAGAPENGPSATADYVPVPGTDASGEAPTITTGDRGVYEADDVTFDQGQTGSQGDPGVGEGVRGRSTGPGSHPGRRGAAVQRGERALIARAQSKRPSDLAWYPATPLVPIGHGVL